MAKKKLSSYSDNSAGEAISSPAVVESTKLQAPSIEESAAERDLVAVGTRKSLPANINSVTIPPDGKAFFNQVGPQQVKLDGEELKR